MASRERERLEPPTWVDAIRAGNTFTTAGPLLNFRLDGERFHASGASPGSPGKLEVVANGKVIATADGMPATGAKYMQAEMATAVPASGWIAARWGGKQGFAHTSPVRVGALARQPDAAAAIRRLIDQTREWVEQYGRYTNPKRREQLFARCAEARSKLEPGT